MKYFLQVLSVVLFGALMPAAFAEQVDEGDDQYISTIYQFVKVISNFLSHSALLPCKVLK